MPGIPLKGSAPEPPPLSSGAIVALAVLSTFAVPVSAFHGISALILSEPPECFLQLTDVVRAQCVQARAEGWSMVPSMLLGGVALLPLLAAVAALVWRRVVAVRWITLGVFVVSFLLTYLVISAQ